MAGIVLEDFTKLAGDERAPSVSFGRDFRPELDACSPEQVGGGERGKQKAPQA